MDPLGGGCSCDTLATPSKPRNELRRGCSYTLERDGGGGVASAPLRTPQFPLIFCASCCRTSDDSRPAILGIVSIRGLQFCVRARQRCGEGIVRRNSCPKGCMGLLLFELFPDLDLESCSLCVEPADEVGEEFVCEIGVACSGAFCC